MNYFSELKLTMVFLIIFSAFSTTSIFAEKNKDSLFPVIEMLNYSDLNYRQLQEDIGFFYKADSSNKELPPLMFYSYTCNEDLNIFSIASQAGVPYDTIASLNRINNASDNLNKKVLLLPSQTGLFLPVKPESDLEYIELSWRSSLIENAKHIKINGTEFYFLPAESYHNVERAYFLNILFANPLPQGVVTSGYGMRNSPFTGHPLFHNGIDIAAPEGTAVHAAREGIVIDEGSNSTFGNYIEIKHSGGYSTFYAHLKKTLVELNDKVNSSIIIGKVGSTGMSTGPHLHFEIRRNGDCRDPSLLAPGLN
ncbi:MAG: M23 family metallopeptidase [Spirochaetales bacterium]|nr:M23 family metallopeptidase [Spirochaetales bacterium]